MSLRMIAFGMSAVLELSAVGCARGPAPIAPASDAPIDPAALSESLAEQAAAIPPERDDLVARTAQLGPGIAPAFALAHDEIRAESYAGALLGAAGAYRNRAGNSIDRSLLLAQVLAAKGLSVRFASCRLDPASAETLAGAMFAPAPAPAPSAVATAGAATPDPSDSVFARILARGNRDFAAVKAALGGSSSFAGMSHGDLASELSNHTWVQASSDGGSTWTDLDASFPDAVPGKHYCDPASTTATLASDQDQTVTIRIGAETLAGGALSNAVLLEQSYPAQSLMDQQIYILQAPQAGSLLGQSGGSAYAPSVVVGGNTVSGKAIPFADGAGGGGNAIGGLAGGLAGGAPAATGASGGPYLVAEWLEFTVTQPGGATDTTRRYLFDRGGTAWRASAQHDPTKLAPMATDANGPLAVRTVYGICVSAGLHDVRSYKIAIASLLDAEAKAAGAPSPAASASAPASQPNIFAELFPFAMRNLGFMVESDERVIPALSDTPDVRFYADSPRIFVFGVGPDPGGSGKLLLTTDLRRDSLRALAKDASGSSAVADGVLRFGVMEGALEAEMAAPSATELKAGATFGSTSDLLGPDGLRVLKSVSDASTASDPETAARLAAALQTGATLVVPNNVLKGGPSGWWEVAADGSRVRAVYGEDLGGGVGFGLPGANGVNAVDQGTYYYVNSDFTSLRYRYGKLTGNFRASEPPSQGGGGDELGEYTKLILAIAFAGAVGVSIMSQEMLVNQARAAAELP